MSEIKFACPHCSQHIVCDEIFCGERIYCPGCGKAIFIPQRAAFIPLHAGNLSVAVPVAFKEPRPAPAGALALGPEIELDDHTAQSRPGRWLPVWILLFLPYALAFVLAVNKMPPPAIMAPFLLCAPALGFYVAAIQNRSGIAFVLTGIAFTAAALVFYVIMAFGLLFIGCLVALR